MSSTKVSKKVSKLFLRTFTDRQQLHINKRKQSDVKLLDKHHFLPPLGVGHFRSGVTVAVMSGQPAYTETTILPAIKHIYSQVYLRV